MSLPMDGDQTHFGLSEQFSGGKSGFRIQLSGTDVGWYHTLSFLGSAINEIRKVGNSKIEITIGSGSVQQLDGNVDISGSLTLTGAFVQHSGLSNIFRAPTSITGVFGLTGSTFNIVHSNVTITGTLTVESQITGTSTARARIELWRPGVDIPDTNAEQFTWRRIKLDGTAIDALKLVWIGSRANLIGYDDGGTGRIFLDFHPTAPSITFIGNTTLSANAGNSTMLIIGSTNTIRGTVILTGGAGTSITGNLGQNEQHIFKTSTHSNGTSLPAASLQNSGSIAWLAVSGTLVVSNGVNWVKVGTTSSIVK